MAKMISMTLTKPLSGYKVSYTGEYETEEKNLIFTKDIPNARDKNVRKEYETSSYPFTYQISLNGTSYINGNSTSYLFEDAIGGEEKCTLYGRYEYHYREGEWTYVEASRDSGLEVDGIFYETRREALNVAENYCEELGEYISIRYQTQTIYEPRVRRIALDNGNVFYLALYDEVVREWSINWGTIQLAHTNSMSIQFYPRPPKFLFDNCRAKGGQWLVDKGINAPYPDGLIYNLTEFQDYANQWMAWKRQNSYISCPEFDSPLSAARINSIYSTLGKTSNYKSGDPVSVNIFQGLENIINE